jgi:hypothetical protein
MLVLAVYPCLCWIIYEHGLPKGLATVFKHKKYNFEEIWWQVCHSVLCDFSKNSEVDMLIPWYLATDLKIFFKTSMRRTGRQNLKQQEYGLNYFDDWFFPVGTTGLRNSMLQVWASTDRWYGCICSQKWWRLYLGLQELWWGCPKWFSGSRCETPSP